MKVFAFVLAWLLASPHSDPVRPTDAPCPGHPPTADFGEVASRAMTPADSSAHGQRGWLWCKHPQEESPSF